MSVDSLPFDGSRRFNTKSKVEMAMNSMEELLASLEDEGDKADERTKNKIAFLRYYLQEPGYERPEDLPVRYNSPAGIKIKSEILNELGIDAGDMPQTSLVRKHLRFLGIKSEEELARDEMTAESVKIAVDKLKQQMETAANDGVEKNRFLNLRDLLVSFIENIRQLYASDKHFQSTCDSLGKMISLVLTPKEDSFESSKMFRRNYELVELKSDIKTFLSSYASRRYVELTTAFSEKLGRNAGEIFPATLEELRKKAGIGDKASSFEGRKPKVIKMRIEKAEEMSSDIKDALRVVDSQRILLENAEWLNEISGGDREMLWIMRRYMQDVPGYSTAAEISARHNTVYGKEG